MNIIAWWSFFFACKVKYCWAHPQHPSSLTCPGRSSARSLIISSYPEEINDRCPFDLIKFIEKAFYTCVYLTHSTWIRPHLLWYIESLTHALRNDLWISFSQDEKTRSRASQDQREAGCHTHAPAHSTAEVTLRSEVWRTIPHFWSYQHFIRCERVLKNICTHLFFFTINIRKTHYETETPSTHICIENKEHLLVLNQILWSFELLEYIYAFI